MLSGDRGQLTWRLWGVLAAVVWLSASGGAGAQTNSDSVLLPFECDVDRGKVVLTPAAERAHRIIGPRASHAFTACRPRAPDRCRTWQVHKFDVACGQARVPWVAVVGAALERRPERGRLDQGRIVIPLSRDWRQAGAALAPTLAFPPGFAPALGFQARFAQPAAAPTVVEARTAPDVRATRPPVRKAEPDTSAAPSSTPAVLQPWDTTIDIAKTAGIHLGTWRAAGLAAVVALLWALLSVMRRRQPAASGADAAAAPNPPASTATPDTDEAVLVTDLIARAVSLHRSAREALALVPNDHLRELLADDLAVVQVQLLEPAFSADVAAARWPEARAVVSAALGQLERIARIIAGVLSAQAGANGRAAAPPELASAADAYRTLGINPDASRIVVKKIVDGLRQSWHPDLARSEPDRQLREARMKEINVAWDLIRAELTGRPNQTTPA